MMIQDVYLRFEDMAAMRVFMRRVEIKNMVGDLFNHTPDPETGDLDEDKLINIRRNVAHVIVPPNTVVITRATYDDEGNELTPSITDPHVWMVLRLMGNTLTRDENIPGDRWNSSKLIKYVRGNSNATKRGARMGRKNLGQQKWVEIYNTEDLIALGIVPHTILGGPK